MVSHGMLIESLGNLHEKEIESEGEYKMINPENFADYSEEEKQKILEQTKHQGWSG